MTWRTVKIGDVCLVKRGTTITEKQAIKGSVPVVAGGISYSYKHNQANRSSNVITVSASGANAGYVNFWDIPIFASDCSTVEAVGNNIDIRFIFYFLRNKQEFINQTMRSGAAQPHVYAKDIAQISLNLPPLAEQKRIAEILDKANEIKAKRELALAKLDELAMSMFEDSIAKVKKSGDYRDVTLNEIAIFYAGNSLPLGTEFLEQKNGYFLMKVSDMNIEGNERYIFRCKEWSSYKGSESGTCPKNSIVIPKRGGAIGTNKKRITTRETILDPNLMAIKAKENLVMTEYLMQWFLNFDLKTITSGSSVPQLNKKDLVPLKVLLPTLHEQLRFANAIKNIENTKKKINFSLEKMSNLLVSLQSQAFTTGFNA